MSKPERRLTIELPDDERGVSPHVVARFDRLKRRLERVDLKPAQREAALDEVLSLERSAQITREQGALDQRIAETVALAQARGEDVRQTKAGPRIVSRGGLTQAYEDGHLTPEHGPQTTTDVYEAGKRYRDAYEIVEGLTSSRGEGAGFGPKAPQIRMVEAGASLLAMRLAISERQRAVLDLVCGKDIRLRAAATELHRGFPSTRNALRGGLVIIAGLKIERNKGAADQLRRKTDAISRAERGA